METISKIIPMSTERAASQKDQSSENVLLAMSQVYAIVQHSIQTSTITQSSVGSIMEQAQSDISGIITALVNNDSSLMSKIEDLTKTLGPLGYVILALTIVVLVAALVAAVVATGGVAAALFAPAVAAGIASASTIVGSVAAIAGGAVSIAKGAIQCEMASMLEELAVISGGINTSNGNQKMWQSDSKHVGDTIKNNGDVESSIEKEVSASIFGSASASASAAQSIRRSL